MPRTYGTGKLWLTARSPASLYACWDLDPAQQRQHNARSVHHHPVLRLHADSAAGPPTTEIHLEPEARHAFVPVEPAAAKYIAVLGYYSSANDWVALATSDPAPTPRDSAADDSTVQFATLPPPAAPIPLSTRVPHVPSPPAEPEDAPIRSRTDGDQPSNTPPLLGPVEMSQAALLPGVPAPAPTGPAPAVANEPLPPFVRARFVEARAGKTTAQVLPENITSPRPQPESPTPASTAWTAAQARALAEEIGVIRHSAEGVSSADIVDLVRRHRARGPSDQESLPLHEAALADAQPQAAFSSPGGSEPAVRRGFWFALNADLVLYGGTEPDATVTIAGRPVQLRSDGSFSCRFALPDGEFELTVAAVSAGQDQRREAQLKLSRHTDYRE